MRVARTKYAPPRTCRSTAILLIPIKSFTWVRGTLEDGDEASDGASSGESVVLRVYSYEDDIGALADFDTMLKISMRLEHAPCPAERCTGEPSASASNAAGPTPQPLGRGRDR
ncbi:MAG: hypothetical protein L0206_25840 [Actinobacteria bacterium]|nr:hypothetical protein [Actinomycetota bacterium]